MPSYWLRWGLGNFLPGLDSKQDPSDISLNILGRIISYRIEETKVRNLELVDFAMLNHWQVLSKIVVYLG
jgi:hypothetical protein